MHNNFILVLFKNKKKKKIIKSYRTIKNATKKFKELTQQSECFFPVEFENAEAVKYEIGLLTSQHKNQNTIFATDEIGRNVSVFVEGSSPYKFMDIKPYNKEELIMDWQLNKRITLSDLIKTYCDKSIMKSIFTLHNKLIVQLEEKYFLFSLKNHRDSIRCLYTIEEFFIEKNRKDAFFVKDISTVQRKWIYEQLVNQGFDKTKLYRQKTTFSKRK
jgi:hypothetical protein